MTNPTSNFGWQMPTSSDLVTDLPADFETFGQAVDTSLADLKGGTTGQVLAKATGTDMDFTWTTPSAGMTNPMTTTGDTIYSSSGSTPARLGIGTTGQVLTVSGGLPAWTTPAGGGGLTLISTTSLTGANVTLSSIPQTYKNLQLVLRNFRPATNGATLRIAINGTGSSGNTRTLGVQSGASTIQYDGYILVADNVENAGGTTHSASIDIYDYAVINTTWRVASAFGKGDSTVGCHNLQGGRFDFAGSAITSLTLQYTSGNHAAGTVLLYGVN